MKRFLYGMYHKYIHALYGLYTHTVCTGRLVKKGLELKYLNWNVTPKKQVSHGKKCSFCMSKNTSKQWFSQMTQSKPPPKKELRSEAILSLQAFPCRIGYFLLPLVSKTSKTGACQLQSQQIHPELCRSPGSA